MTRLRELQWLAGGAIASIALGGVVTALASGTWSSSFVPSSIAIYTAGAIVIVASGVVALVRPVEFTLWAIPTISLVPSFVRIPSLGGPDLTPQRALILFCLALTLASVPASGRTLPQRFTFWAALFTLYVLGDAAVHGGHLQMVNRALAYTVESFLPLYIVFRVVRNRAELNRLLNRIVVVVTAACALAIFEEVRGRYLFRTHDPFFVHPATRNGMLRVQAIFPHPLVLGVVVCLVLPIAVNKALGGECRRRNVLAASIMAAALVLSQGRGPILVAFAELVVLAAILRGSRRLGLAAVLVALLAALAFSPWGPGEIAKAVQNPTVANGGFSVNYRQQLLSQSFEYANGHPLGAAPGNAAAIPLTTTINGQATDLAISIDNAYAKYALELGWPGLLLFLLVLIQVGRAMLVAARIDPDGPALLAALVGIVLASFTVATFTWAQVLLLFWTLAGCAFWLARTHVVPHYASERPKNAELRT